MRFLLLAVVLCGNATAAPVPESPAKVLVTGLSDPSDKVRDASSAALRNRPDAMPWVRRAAHSADKDTARRAAALLALAEAKRQEVVAKAIDTCVRDRRADLFMEWHQFWRPRDPEDLWPVGARMGKAAVAVNDTIVPPGESNWLEHWMAVFAAETKPARYLDGPLVFEHGDGAWHVRTARFDTPRRAFAFASVDGPISDYYLQGGYFYALGSVYTNFIDGACVICDGPVSGHYGRFPGLRRAAVGVKNGFLACRGDVHAVLEIRNSVLLVDGDIDLTRASVLKNSLIRASGEIRRPKSCQPINCTIEAHAKNPTAPYKFFELADVGLSLADDEEGLVVTGAKPDTPFGACGLAKGDLIRAIDDVPAGHSETFRKAVRRALVRQGDCLVTVTRGDKTIDLTVFFPLLK